MLSSNNTIMLSVVSLVALAACHTPRENGAGSNPVVATAPRLPPLDPTLSNLIDGSVFAPVLERAMPEGDIRSCFASTVQALTARLDEHRQSFLELPLARQRQQLAAIKHGAAGVPDRAPRSTKVQQHLQVLLEQWRQSVLGIVANDLEQACVEHEHALDELASKLHLQWDLGNLDRCIRGALAVQCGRSGDTDADFPAHVDLLLGQAFGRWNEEIRSLPVTRQAVAANRLEAALRAERIGSAPAGALEPKGRPATALVDAAGALIKQRMRTAGVRLLESLSDLAPDRASESWRTLQRSCSEQAVAAEAKTWWLKRCSAAIAQIGARADPALNVEQILSLAPATRGAVKAVSWLREQYRRQLRHEWRRCLLGASSLASRMAGEEGLRAVAWVKLKKIILLGEES